MSWVNLEQNFGTSVQNFVYMMVSLQKSDVSGRAASTLTTLSQLWFMMDSSSSRLLSLS